MRLKKSTVIILSSVLLVSGCLLHKDAGAATTQPYPALPDSQEDIVNRTWKVRTPGENGQYQNSAGTIEKVKVGIVDSGVNTHDPKFEGVTFHDKAVTRVGDADVKGIKEHEDLDKHGTNMTLLAIKNALNAEYYVANPLQPTLEDGVSSCGWDHDGPEGECGTFPTEEAVDKLASKGLQIINNSYGVEKDDDDLTYRDYFKEELDSGNLESMTKVQNELEIYKRAVQKNTLLVVSTGNEGTDYPGGLIFAPTVKNFESIADGFLAVSAQREEDTFANEKTKYKDLFADGLEPTDPNKDKEGDWANYAKFPFENRGDYNIGANRCEDAADYCLAAPSAIFRYVMIKGKPQLRAVKGTSPSAGYTTGVAADVLSRFSWMKNKNIKEVLLGTAEDFVTDKRDDTIGIDEFTGWGMINPKAAAKGYGKFAWGQSELDIPAGIVSHFDNDINDSVIKKGKKVVERDGLGGFIKLGEGTLVLNGQNTFKGGAVVNAGEVVINGSNISAFTVNETGVLRNGDKTGNSVGALTNNAKVINQEVNNLTVSGDYTQTATATLESYLDSQLAITGQAKLDGVLHLKGVSYLSKTPVKRQVLQADGGLNNTQFTQVISPTGELLDIATTYNTTNVEVSASRKSVVEVANTEKSIQLEGKQQLAGALESALTDFDQKFANGPSIDKHELLLANRIIHTPNLANILYKHNPDIYLNSNLNQAIEQVALNNRFANKLSMPESALWLDSDAKNIKSKFDGIKGKTKNYTQSLGGKMALANDDIIAAQLNIHNLSWEDEYEATYKRSKSNGIGAIVGYRTTLAGLNITPLLSYSHMNNKVKGNQQSKYDGQQLAIALTADKELVLSEQFTIRPKIALQYTHLKADSVKDEYVTVNDYSLKQTTATLGVEGLMKVSNQMSLFADLSYERDLHRSNKVGFAFNFNPNSINQLSGWDIYRNRFMASLGGKYQLGNNVSLRLSYSYKGGDKMKSQAVNGLFTYKF